MRISIFIAILTIVLLLVGYVGWHLWRIVPGGYKCGALGVFVLWTITFFVAGKECELTDYQTVAIHIKDASVHDVVLVAKHA